MNQEIPINEFPKRKVDVLIISDVHLGTYGCHAKELLTYLNSIEPKNLILNGDIIDMWQFSKRYWPPSHMLVLKHLAGLIAQGTMVHYVTGNHDEMLRKFVGFSLGSFRIVNKVKLSLDDRVAWVFHGDVFDVTMQHSKWLTKLGAIGYDMLIILNRIVNFISIRLGYEKLSLSKKVKDGVKSAVKFINNFEQTASEIAIDNDYDYVICGHIHQPGIKLVRNEKGSTIYMNSGDWVENLTALEYNNGEWELYRFNTDMSVAHIDPKSFIGDYNNNATLFEEMVREFQNMAS